MALRSDSLNAISICAGAGGLDLALQLAEPRARTVAAVCCEGGMMAHREIWSRCRLGTKLSVTVSPDGEKIGIGLTNMLARGGVADFVTREDARALHAALGELLAENPTTSTGKELQP